MNTRIDLLLGAFVLAVSLSGIAMAQDEATQDEPVQQVQSETCADNFVFISTTPAPPQVPSSVHQLLRTPIPAQADLVVLGDSIATQLAVEGGLADKVGAATSLVYSGGGDSVQNAIYRLAIYEPELKRLAPNDIFVAIGTNNLGLNSCAIEAGLGKYFDQIRQIWPDANMYVMSILPRGPSFAYQSERREQVNEFIATKQSELNFRLVQIDDSQVSCNLLSSSVQEAVSAISTAAKVAGEQQCMSPEVRGAGTLPGDGTVSCSTSIKLQCEYFRDDNVHLSELGVSWVTDLVSGAILAGANAN